MPTAPAEARPLSGGQAHVPAQAPKRGQLVGHPGPRGSPAQALACRDLRGLSSHSHRSSVTCRSNELYLKLLGDSTVSTWCGVSWGDPRLAAAPQPVMGCCV